MTMDDMPPEEIPRTLAGAKAAAAKDARDEERAASTRGVRRGPVTPADARCGGPDSAGRRSGGDRGGAVDPRPSERNHDLLGP